MLLGLHDSREADQLKRNKEIKLGNNFHEKRFFHRFIIFWYSSNQVRTIVLCRGLFCVGCSRRVRCNMLHFFVGSLVLYHAIGGLAQPSCPD